MMNDLIIRVVTVNNNVLEVETLKKYFNKKAKIEIINTDKEEKKILKEVTHLLHDLGMPSNIKGYQYVRSAIVMVYENPNLIGEITKQLYPDLSIKFNTSTKRVERAIRHAIQVSFDRCDVKKIEEIFGNSISIDKDKPTNSEFIVTLADNLRLASI